MKLLKKEILSLFGTLLLIVTLSACNTDNIPENRTKEEYNVENSFQPVFDFLEEDPKDFSNMESFSSNFSIIDKDTYEKDEESYSLLLKSSSEKFSGTYRVQIDGLTTEYLISVINNLEIKPENEIPEEFNKLNILLPIIPTSEIKKLNVDDYLAKHPETELKAIYYQIPKNYTIFQNLINTYNISEITSTDMAFSLSGDVEYTMQYSIITNQKMYVVTQNITFKR